MRRRIRCFEEETEGATSYTLMEAGLRVVEIRRIVGTVDKCNELDENFHYLHRKDRHERSRRHGMEEAVRKNLFLPPVDLYLYRGEYYVLDGNRRVATARDMKIEFIDARVTEYVPRDSGVGVAGVMARRRFESETGIKSITLTHEIGFRQLWEEAMGYPYEGDTVARARRWYTERFLPSCRRIEASSLPRRYRDLQIGDIYVLISGFYRSYMGGVPADAHYDSVISGFMFAHGIKRRRITRVAPLKLLTSFIMRRGMKRGS